MGSPSRRDVARSAFPAMRVSRAPGVGYHPLRAPWRRRVPAAPSLARGVRACAGSQEEDEEHQLRQAADELLASGEAAGELRKLAAAEARLAAAQSELAAFERNLVQAEAAQAQAARERGADSSMAKAQAELQQAAGALAAAGVERAAAEQAAKAAEGEPLALLWARSPTPTAAKWATRDVDDTAERAESGKAAAVAGFAGVLATLPLSLAQGGLTSCAAVFVSCALMFVVYRYALRRDVGNPHLKGGVIASFGLVRGLAQADTFLVQAAGGAHDALPSVEVAAQAALLLGEAVLTFALAGAALEAGIARGVISTFPKQAE